MALLARTLALLILPLNISLLFPALLTLETFLLLLLALLFPALLALLAGLLLLAALLATLLLFDSTFGLLRCLRCLTLFAALFPTALSLLSSLISLGLVFLAPLFASAASALGTRKVGRARECCNDRRRHREPFNKTSVHQKTFQSTDMVGRTWVDS